MQHDSGEVVADLLELFLRQCRVESENGRALRPVRHDDSFPFRRRGPAFWSGEVFRPSRIFPGRMTPPARMRTATLAKLVAIRVISAFRFLLDTARTTLGDIAVLQAQAAISVFPLPDSSTTGE